MVIVNDIEVPIYDLDTKETFISRIASRTNTLPRYIYFPQDFEIQTLKNSDSEIEMEDLLKIIIDNAKSSTNFLKLMKKLETKVANLDVIKDILHVWLAYNTNLNNIYKQNSMILTHIEKTLRQEGYDIDLLRFWQQDRESVKSNLKLRIENIKDENEKLQELYQVFHDIGNDGFVYTDFITTRVTLNVITDIKDITLLEIFNNINLNDGAPFATTRNYYKILKDYIPQELSFIPENDELIVKVCEKFSIDPSKYNDYTNVKMSLKEDNVDEKVALTVRLITERGYLSLEKFLERFVSIFPHPVKFEQIDEEQVIGNFYFPQERFNAYVFADLAMDNSLFESMITIDESSKTTKRKSGSGQQWLHFHFTHPNTGLISVGIMQKTVDRTSPEFRETNEEIFPHNQPYINVGVKGRDIASIQIFQDILSKLMVIYNENYGKIVEIYQEYLPDFGIIEEIEFPEQKKRLEMKAPEVFVKNYSRNCTEERAPTMITEKEAKKQKNQYLVFPRPASSEYEISYPSDGVNPNYYICKNPEFPFPGLQINKLTNADAYPYLPCCFKTDQTKKGKNYRIYYHDENLEQRDKKEQDLIITEKILKSDKHGILSPEISKMFEMVDLNPKFKYIRVGVNRNPSSFISCLLLAFHDELQTPVSEWDEKLLKIRKKLAKIAPIAKQCMYDVSVETITAELLDEKAYLDPRKYIQLLENYFGCNIYMFDNEKMILPKSSQGYYRKIQKGPCVFIYEHFGSESDHARYPQCELIAKWETKSTEVQYNFEQNSEISKRILMIYNLVSESYIFNKKLKNVVFPEFNLISQEIDSYGKCRRIDVKTDFGNMTVLTSPIPPEKVPNTNTEILLVSAKDALKFISQNEGRVMSQTVHSKKTKEINAKIGNVDITIPVIKTDVLGGIPISNDSLHYAPASKSSIKIYNDNKKLARYITEYMFWMFSDFIKDENLEKIDKLMAKFAKEKIHIQEDYEYSEVSKVFSLESSLVKNGKLIVKSQEMLKRMMYILRLYFVRDFHNLISYHTRRVINHYYVEITDFDYNPRQVILYGDDSIDKWIAENKFIYNIHKEIDAGKKIPYFFKNNLISKDIFLAQNTDTYENAIAISVIWQKNKYNAGKSVISSEPEDYESILYNYVSDKEITSMIVLGKTKAPSPIRIIGYKLFDKPFYTVLLDLA